jgi:hypothetical protein
MKKIALFAVVSLLAISCTTLKEIPSYSLLNKIDFRKYSDAGFLFTPEKYEGEYKSIGVIDFKKMPGALYTTIKELKNKDNYIPEHPEISTISTQWFTEMIDMDQAIDELYRECISLGADALMNFKIDYYIETRSNISNPISITGYKISGFAIKRINN